MSLSDEYKKGQKDTFEGIIRVLNKELDNIQNGSPLVGFYHGEELQKLVERMYSIFEDKNGRA